MKRICAIALGAAMLPGCSLVLMQKVPPNHAQLNGFECTSQTAAPTLDAVWGTLNAIGAASAIATQDQPSTSGPPKGVVAVVGVAWALISIPSAVWGFRQARECRQAKDELYARLNRSPPPAFLADGCRKDTDCKGDRICERGYCVAPGTQPPIAVPAVAVPRPPVPAPRVQRTGECQSDSECDAGICYDGVCRRY